MRFQIGDTVYNAADLDLVSLRDILMFEKETADMGRPFSWAEIGEISERVSASDDAESEPGAMWLTAVTVWATRRSAGESITFEEAVNFPVRDFKVLPEPQDHKAKANPTKARPTPKGSVRAAKLAAATTDSGPSSQETSAAESMSA